MPPKVYLLKKENETLKGQIANLTKELKNLKKMLEQRQETLTTDDAERSLQFLSDGFDDFNDFRKLAQDEI